MQKCGDGKGKTRLLIRFAFHGDRKRFFLNEKGMRAGEGSGRVVGSKDEGPWTREMYLIALYQRR